VILVTVLTAASVAIPRVSGRFGCRKQAAGALVRKPARWVNFDCRVRSLRGSRCHDTGVIRITLAQHGGWTKPGSLGETCAHRSSQSRPGSACSRTTNRPDARL